MSTKKSSKTKSKKKAPAARKAASSKKPSPKRKKVSKAKVVPAAGLEAAVQELTGESCRDCVIRTIQEVCHTTIGDLSDKLEDLCAPCNTGKLSDLEDALASCGKRRKLRCGMSVLDVITVVCGSGGPMRFGRLAVLLLFFAIAAKGQGFDKTAFFPNAAHKPPDLTSLTIEFNTVTLAPENACPRDVKQSDGSVKTVACSEMYRLENRTAPYVIIPIHSAGLGTNAATSAAQLQLAIDPPQTVKGLTLVIFNLQSTPVIANSTVPKGYVEIPIAPQLSQQGDDETAVFESIHPKETLFYRALTPITFPADSVGLQKLRARLSNSISVTDPGEFDRAYAVYVNDIAQPTNQPVIQMEITGAPRGKKLNVKVGGLETLGAEPLAASTAIQSVAIPKARDDADVWVKVAAEADDVKRERKYSIDTKLHDAFRSGRWDLGPTFDATVGNKTSKAPNSGSLSFDFKRFFKGGGPLHSQSLTFSPIYRSDRSFDNRDAGFDLVYEPFFTRLENTLDQRRKAEKRLGGPPLVHVWGWRIRPSAAVEFGHHIDSSAPEVNDKEFKRLRAGISAAFEYLRWKLTVAGEWRHLFDDEVLLQDTVVTVAQSDRKYGRADLSYDLGNVALTLTHMNGRKPPAFSSTHSTSFGVTLKF
jgi:hypothetical protein